MQSDASCLELKHYRGSLMFTTAILMIFSDGAGAAILEATTDSSVGILAHKTQTHAADCISALGMEPSYSPYGDDKNELFLKMQGRKVYEFALTHVPGVMKDVLDKAGITIDQVSKILLHQANEKMDRAILARLLQLCGKEVKHDSIMPMTIQWLGNKFRCNRTHHARLAPERTTRRAFCEIRRYPGDGLRGCRYEHQRPGLSNVDPILTRQ